MAELSRTMRQCVEFMKKHGGDITRHQGGFWSHKDWPLVPGRTFGTSTVEALVARGVATYTNHQTGRNGCFPIRAVLQETGNQ